MLLKSLTNNDSQLFFHHNNWTYFSVYVVIFLITSVICAMRVRTGYNAQKTIQEVQQDHFDKWSKKGVFKQWPNY